MGGGARWLWLPALVSTGCAWVMYRIAFAAELGSRAGAEPVAAGLAAAFPFAALALLQALLALYAALDPPARGLVAARWCSTLSATVVAAVVVGLAVSQSGQGYLSTGLAGWTALLVGALLLPLAPAWISASRGTAARRAGGT